jgi:hypothetical protein
VQHGDGKVLAMCMAGDCARAEDERTVLSQFFAQHYAQPLL